MRTVKNKNSILRIQFIEAGGWTAFVVGILCFALFGFLDNYNGMLIGILLILGGDLCFALSGFSKYIGYILFLFSFFSFMLGRMVMDFLMYGKIGLQFPRNIVIHILFSIALSLVAMQAGFWCSNCLHKKTQRHLVWTKRKLRGTIFQGYNNRLQTYAKILFLFSAVLMVMENLEQFLFIRQHSYVELYTKFISRIPKIFQIFGNMYIAFFTVYLGTCPPKRKCKYIIGIFVIITVFKLLTGDRGEFVINIAMILVYVFWRQYRDCETWISNKLVVCGIAILPFVIAGMSFFVYLREGVDVGELSLSAQFIRFFRVTGKTVDMLGYGKKYQGQLPKTLYSLGELIDYCIYNPIMSTIFNIEKPRMHTAEYAQSMHSFAHIMSYYQIPKTYLEGHGLGSAYLAEAYYDFGYFGVVLCNLIYGYFLSLLHRVKKENPIHIAVYLIALRIMFYVPRGTAIQPLTYVLNITTITALVTIWFGARFFRVAVSKKEINEKNTFCD